MSLCVFVVEAPLRERTHRNNTHTKEGGKTALEENLLNKYSRILEGNRTASFLQLALVASASCLVWLHIQYMKQRTEYRNVQLLSPAWFHYFNWMPESTASQCSKVVFIECI